MPQEGTILHKLGVDHQIFDEGGGGGEAFGKYQKK